MPSMYPIRCPSLCKLTGITMVAVIDLTTKWLRMIKSALFALPTVYKTLKAARCPVANVYNIACPFCPELRSKSGMRKYRANTIEDCRMYSFNTTVCACAAGGILTCSMPRNCMYESHAGSPPLSDRIDLTLQDSCRSTFA